MSKFEIITSWDDGYKLDLKLVKLLKKYKLPGIFFIPGNRELLDFEIRDIAAQGFEIGAHTTTHSILSDLSARDVKWEIISNKQDLENIIKKEVKAFCYPRGKYNERIKKLIAKAGFKWARTVDVLNIDRPFDPYETKTTIHAYPQRKEYKKKYWLSVAKDMFDDAKEKEGVYHLWGHSYELERYHIWDQLEELLQYISKNR